MINTEPTLRSRFISSKRYETNDIFNRQQTNNNTINSFKQSNIKNNSNRNIFEESRNEKRLIENSKSKRPDFIRNPFTSQITIK